MKIWKRLLPLAMCLTLLLTGCGLLSVRPSGETAQGVLDVIGGDGEGPGGIGGILSALGGEGEGLDLSGITGLLGEDFSLTDLLGEGFSLEQIIGEDGSLGDLLGENVSLQDVLGEGVSLQDILSGGVSLEDLAESGALSEESLEESGITAEDLQGILNSGVISEADLAAAGVDMEALEGYLGTSGSEPIDEAGSYTRAEDVALYLHTYGHLPQNFITKEEARALGWPGGGLEDYAPGKCIGGDYFGNYEGLLPAGHSYRECDIDTLGASARGAKRIIYSDDGLIYYTEDHYESFTLLYGEE